MSAADRTEANKAAFSRFHDITNSGDAAAVAKVIKETAAPDLRFHAPVPNGLSGVEALQRVWAMLLRAFPDLHVTTEDLLADGDKIVARNIVTGTHQGDYMGLAPTGKTVRYQEIFIIRYDGGRMAEIWGVVDVLAQRQQLGLVTV